MLARTSWHLPAAHIAPSSIVMSETLAYGMHVFLVKHRLVDHRVLAEGETRRGRGLVQPHPLPGLEQVRVGDLARLLGSGVE